MPKYWTFKRKYFDSGIEHNTLMDFYIINTDDITTTLSQYHDIPEKDYRACSKIIEKFHSDHIEPFPQDEYFLILKSEYEMYQDMIKSVLNDNVEYQKILNKRKLLEDKANKLWEKSCDLLTELSILEDKIIKQHDLKEKHEQIIKEAKVYNIRIY
jgi:hypothetical protein